MRRQKGGKLPIGSVEAQIGSVGWMFGTRHNIDVSIRNDFSFTDTNQMHHLKVSPSLRLWEKGNKQP
ncbi:MAG: hypothetical protein IJ615_07960 [Bacteroidaceae bacterium]|nr:hypothetical protein [Bacteroidaceae bacterium]